MKFPQPPPKLTRFLKQVLLLVGTPYIWGGRSSHGLDCFGLPALAYKQAGGANLFNWNTHSAWTELGPAEDAAPGRLVFFGSRDDGTPNHVMVCLPLGMLVGATGGNSTVTTAIEASRRHAAVTLWEPNEYPRLAKDFRGYRRLPFEGE